MKWFKHLSGSLNNSIISEAIERFGGDGYLVFFGILELVSDEFDIYNPGVKTLRMKKITKNLQLSRQKTVKILRFFDEKAKIKSNKNVSFFADIQKNLVTINCKRLAELCDNHTQKLLKDTSKSLQSSIEVTSSLEAEAEVEADLKANQQADFFRNKIHPYFVSIEKSCLIVSKLPQKPQTNKFNSFAFVNREINKNNSHPGAVDHTLKQMVIYWETIDNPWKYSTKIMKKENGNFWEREHIENHEQLKSEFVEYFNDDRIKSLVGGVFEKI